MGVATLLSDRTVRSHELRTPTCPFCRPCCEHELSVSLKRLNKMKQFSCFCIPQNQPCREDWVTLGGFGESFLCWTTNAGSLQHSDSTAFRVIIWHFCGQKPKVGNVEHDHESHVDLWFSLIKFVKVLREVLLWSPLNSTKLETKKKQKGNSPSPKTRDDASVKAAALKPWNRHFKQPHEHVQWVDIKTRGRSSCEAFLWSLRRLVLSFNGKSRF